MGFSLNLFGRGKEKGPSTAERRLADAIAKKLCVTASYNRGPIHLYQPYALFEPTAGGSPVLLAVKVDGLVGHSNHEHLEPMDVSKLALLELTDQDFEPDPRFDPRNTKVGGTIRAAV